jgi:hypothetical protein
MISQPNVYSVYNTRTVYMYFQFHVLKGSCLTVAHKYPLPLSWPVTDPVHVSWCVTYDILFRRNYRIFIIIK